MISENPRAMKRKIRKGLYPLEETKRTQTKSNKSIKRI
jgi:hypothetical protein